MESSQSGVASSKEMLPVTTLDSTAQDGNKAVASKSESMSLKLAIQYLAVVILLNMILYNTVRYSSGEATNFGDCSHENATLDPSRFTNDLGKLSSDSNSGYRSHGNDHTSAWSLEAAGAYTKKISVSFSDVTAICANYSEENSPSRCTTNTIASVILLSSSILSFRSELINFTTPHLSNGRPLDPDFDSPGLLDMMHLNPSEFPKAVPYYATHTLNSPVHHVGYYCPLSSPCTNPVFSIYTHEEIPILFTFLPSILDTNTEVLKFGFGNATGYHFSTNNFANGGFDILFEKARSPLLDPKNDYSQMKQELHRLFNDELKLNGLFFNVHTYDSREKGLRGAVIPWICSERSEIERMETVVTSEQKMTTCAAAIVLRHLKRVELWILGGSYLGLAGSVLLLSLFSWWLENRQGRIRL
ncbi:hypothetical protein BOTNAR_0467g00110 [Botryotinia narcissicola]|uniref:Uncharacterized protein n=1 Tax=Botryotinia narcissicola TaxID=278944 RepID=A0A4Z1HHV4_9HELO|nr:hypothetical protein BOTNAR_0467g00110 [Botryotinia narcissicola]